MPRNGSGTSSVINTFVIDTVADPDEVNANFTDVADQLTNSLPRDGQAGMNAPLPLQNGTDALPALTFSSDPDTGIYRRSANTLGLSLGGIGYPLDAGVVYAAKSGNYTAVLGDNNATHRYTASATVTLTAAATLGLSWHYTIVADGGNVTIDPNGAETINGVATYLVAKGSSATIICDGSAFFVASKPHVWETINYFSLAAAANFSQTGIGGFLMLKLTGQISNSINSSFGIRTSTNNGSSYDSGATDYGYQLLGGTGATTTSASSNSSVGVVTATSASAIIFETIITNFGLTGECYMTSRVGGNTGAALLSEANFAKRSNNTARNAFLFFPAVGGNMTGFVTLEGIRA